MTQAEPKIVLEPDTLYEGDNGRLFCGIHGGASAQYTGRDLSGHKIHKVTAVDRQSFQAQVGRPPACETCAARLRRGLLAVDAEDRARFERNR